MRERTTILLVLALWALAACRGAPEAGGTPGGAAPVPAGSPLAVVERYTAACETGDVATATGLWGEVQQEGIALAGPCSAIEEAYQTATTRGALGEPELRGETTYVTWQWAWEEPVRVERVRVALAQEGAGWRVIEVQRGESYSEVREAVTEALPAPVEVQQNGALPEGISYVVQEGVDGERMVVRVTGSDGSERIEEQRITQEPVTWQVVEGTRPAAEVEATVEQWVEDYFAAYQSGDFERVVEMAPEAAPYPVAAASEVARLELVRVEVGSPQRPRVVHVEELALEARSGEPKRAAEIELAGRPYLEPIGLEWQVPAEVDYRLFGLELQTQLLKIRVRWDPTTDGWESDFWGVWGAGASGETQTLAGVTITLEGIALLPTETLVVVSADSRKTAFVVLPEAGREVLVNYNQLPLGAAWFATSLDPAQEAVVVGVRVGFLGIESMEERSYSIPLVR